jgi:hypothetical protein
MEPRDGGVHVLDRDRLASGTVQKSAQGAQITRAGPQHHAVAFD